MESSFDFGKLVQKNEKRHKCRPAQFGSVANGVKKRLETGITNRKSVRLSVFDRIRNLPKAEDSPKKEIQSKVEYRKLQLKLWKEEKEKQKKEALKQKKKPFKAGVPHNPIAFVPPPPVKCVPSTSGRVTRSKSASSTQQTTKIVNSNTSTQKSIIVKKKSQPSFAPKNAKFNPMLINISQPSLKPYNDQDEGVTMKNNKTKPKASPKLYETRTLRSRTADNLENSLESKELSSENKIVDNLKKKRVPKSKTSSKAKLVDNINKNQLPFSKPEEKILNSSKRNQVPKVMSSSEEEILVSPKRNQVPKVMSSSEEEILVSPKRNQVPKCESSSEEKLRSPKMDIVEAMMHSPCVTVSRGKDNARREMRQKINEGLLDDEVFELDNVEHFRHQMDSEIKRMTELCDTWTKISEQMLLPDTVQEAILAAVGQARLLMSQKLQQFASLLLRCECPDPTQALVTPGDLHGFWDMVFMQVTDVDMRFKKLEVLRSRGWVEEQPVEQKKKIGRAPVNKNKPAATSRLRDMIAAARKAKKEQVTATNNTENKVFEAGFFNVTSPIKSPKPPSTPSLLKAVLSSEAKKASASKNAASHAMLRASMLGKNVDIDYMQNPTELTPINLNATPAKSILKSNAKSERKSSKKSIKVVLFNNSDDDLTVDSTSDCNDKEEEKEKEKKVFTEEKENKRISKLVRQDAMDEMSPRMTRSRRKSHVTDERKKLQELDENVVDTPRRSRRKSVSVRV